MTSGEDFFDEMKEQSHVKVEIVKKFFLAWANVLLPSVESRDGKLGYIDLNAYCLSSENVMLEVFKQA